MMLTRPQRKVVPWGAGYAVDHPVGDVVFSTTDRVLAEAVAREFDRLDPLPFPPHDCREDTVAAHVLSQVDPVGVWCQQCGQAVTL